MSTVGEIIKAAEGLAPEEFLKLRTRLDRVEEKLWNRELGRVTAKHRKEKLTDAKIDELVLKRRYRGRHEGRLGHDALGFLLRPARWIPASSH